MNAHIILRICSNGRYAVDEVSCIGAIFCRTNILLAQLWIITDTSPYKIGHKGALSWYGKLTWESAHAWNLIILCLLIVWGMTFIFMVHLSFYAIPLLIYDVMYDITTIP